MPVKSNFDLPREVRRGLDRVETELNRIGLEMVRLASDFLDREKINVEGDLKKSLTHQVDRFLSGIRLIVGAGANHAPFVHSGTRPHFPPPEPIVRWVQKKLDVPESEVRSAAFLIARKISKEGTKAKPFLDFALNRMRNRIASRVETAFLRGLNIAA